MDTTVRYGVMEVNESSTRHIHTEDTPLRAGRFIAENAQPMGGAFFHRVPALVKGYVPLGFTSDISPDRHGAFIPSPVKQCVYYPEDTPDSNFFQLIESSWARVAHKPMYLLPM